MWTRLGSSGGKDSRRGLVQRIELKLRLKISRNRNKNRIKILKTISILKLRPISGKILTREIIGK